MDIGERRGSRVVDHTTGCAWRLMTPAGVAGAVAIVQIVGDPARAFEILDMPVVDVGEVALRSLFGVDRALVARVSESCVQLMPHGGTAVVREILSHLTARGIVEASSVSAMDEYPEARDEVEARALAAVAGASSPLAVDLLLDQARRWREGGAEVTAEHAAMLRHVLRPALVVMVGPANVGKSTLLNRLAGRGVAIVADEPGTTRDHVGVVLDVGGVVVRFVDTPGVRPGADAIEAEAMAGARELAGRADLLVLVADAGTSFLEWAGSGRRIRVGLRADLGMTPGADLCVSARTGGGLEALAGLIRGALVSGEALADPGAWRFWEG